MLSLMLYYLFPIISRDLLSAISPDGTIESFSTQTDIQKYSEFLQCCIVFYDFFSHVTKSTYFSLSSRYAIFPLLRKSKRGDDIP